MLISKFDLYRGEWLSLVFKGRNQQYGAFELRDHYANVMVKAMAVTFITVAAIGLTTTIIARNKPVEPVTHIVNITIFVPPKEKVYEAQKPKELPKPKQAPEAAASKAPAVQTQVFIAMKPVVDDQAVDPQPLRENIAVASVATIGDGKNAENIAQQGTGDGKGTDGPPENADGTVGIGGLQVMPQFAGGEAAWAKFLQKNIRYPAQAQDQGVSGKVFLSFIIEKDGHLSDIAIVRKAGYGFDEEATRVLKLAPAWKPGLQNGMAVRVRYTIPINFQMGD